MTKPPTTPEIDQLRSLRDRYLALTSGSTTELDEAGRRRVRALVDATTAEPVLELDGLALTWHPSARFSTLRFVEAERIPEHLRPLFARPVSELPNLAAVFVDAEEFSYRTFENILPLDRYFEGLELGCALQDRKPLRAGKSQTPSAYTFSLSLADEARAALAGLDELNLYVPPLNAASRGGKRFIFHAARLSDALTEALKAALPKPWKKRFVHVNPVFRCNRFEPGDAKFSRHVDTPYYDAARKHVSRYTLLIYLSEGRGEPALRIGDDIVLESIAALTCVVFAQDLEHEGAAYVDGRKVFLRTELIFEDASVTHEPAIARWFAKACYLTGESVFRPELARRTHELYERAAAAHWAGRRREDAGAEPEPCLHKRFRNIEFVTNGYDFWFAKQPLSLRECAVVAVLDLLNCKVGGRAFRQQCETEVVTRAEPASAWVPAYLAERARGAGEPLEPLEPLFMALDQRPLFPPCEAIDDSSCCPFHAYRTWDATRARETVELYQRAQKFAKRRIAGAPITMMGQEIFIDPDKIVVADGKIHVLSDQALAPVNFAACWNDGTDPGNYLDVEVGVEAPHLLVPPILYVETEQGYHLMLDLFRNSWMVDHRPRSVPVPRLRNFGIADYDSGDYETRPWLDAAAKVEGAGEGTDEDDDEPWWEDSAIVRELYADD